MHWGCARCRSWRYRRFALGDALRLVLGVALGMHLDWSWMSHLKMHLVSTIGRCSTWCATKRIRMVTVNIAGNSDFIHKTLLFPDWSPTHGPQMDSSHGYAFPDLMHQYQIQTLVSLTLAVEQYRLLLHISTIALGYALSDADGVDDGIALKSAFLIRWQD